MNKQLKKLLMAALLFFIPIILFITFCIIDLVHYTNTGKYYWVFHPFAAMLGLLGCALILILVVFSIVDLMKNK